MNKISNPFVISGIIPDELFCDRQKESERIIRLLTNGNNIVLISPRRLGKTGLIHHCFNATEIKDNFTTIFVDIFQTTSLREFTFLLGKAVYDAVVPHGKKLVSKFIDSLKSLSGKFTYDPVTGTPSFSLQIGDISRPDFTLEEIFKFFNHSSSRCIVAIDEFQQITEYPEKNVEAVLRTHIQHSSNCNFIFAGSRQHLIREMFVSHARPFYNSSSMMHLDPIPKEIYIDFVGRLFHEYGKNVEEGVASEVYERFEGNTFFMQSLFNEAFSLTPSGNTCSLKTVENALNEIIDFNAGNYQEILANIPLRQKEVLLSIVRNEPARGITSSAFIKENGLLSASSVQAAVKQLIDRSLIVKSGNDYSVPDKFLGIWLRRTY